MPIHVSVMIRTLVATVLSATLACQMLVADRAACVASRNVRIQSSTPPGAYVPPRAMAGMHMATTPIGSAELSSESVARGGRLASPPCHEPTGAASCLLMPACVASFVLVQAEVLGVDLLVSTHVVATRALEPSSRTTRPEFPPPRA